MPGRASRVSHDNRSKSIGRNQPPNTGSLDAEMPRSAGQWHGRAGKCRRSIARYGPSQYRLLLASNNRMSNQKASADASAIRRRRIISQNRQPAGIYRAPLPAIMGGICDISCCDVLRAGWHMVKAPPPAP